MEAEIFVATRNHLVFEALDRFGVNYQVGLFTDELCAALQTAHKVIVDPDDLVPLKYSVTATMGMISQQGVESWSSERFLQDPNEFLKLVSAGASGPVPPKRVIAFTSYSGGTGKTTLALDTALRFARATQRAAERPALLIEFTFGASALAALTGLQMPSLFDLVTTDVNELEPARYNGVTLIPMEYETARDLSLDLVRDFLKKQTSDHILTVVDAHWPHGLLPAVQDFVDRWLIVTTPRVDAVANAEKLRGELKERAFVALNQRGGLVDNLALSGFQKDLDLPRVGRPEAFEGKQLGEAILQWLYGKQAWAKYSQPTPWWSTLFRPRRK
jgi:hypothetical protein